jgi:UDP-glucose 4-epimerase
MAQTVWIMGGAGFIGRAVVAGWQATGVRVGGCGHGCERQSADWVGGPLGAGSFDLLQAATGRPDIVYQLAGGSSVGASLADPARDAALTLGSTDALIQWLGTHAPEARVVAASSAAVYGDGHEGPIREDAQLYPYSPYGENKLAMEQMLASSPLRVAIVRLFSVYGPGLRKQLLWDACCKLAARPDCIEFGGTGLETRDFLYIDDAVDLLVRAAGAAQVGATIVNGGTGTGTSVAQAVGLLSAAMDVPCDISFSGVVRSGDPVSLVADVARARALGFVAQTSPSEGFGAYVRWFATAGAA